MKTDERKDEGATKDFEEWNWYIAFVTVDREEEGGNVGFWHFIGQDIEPTSEDMTMYMKEVKEDEEFGIPEEIKDRLEAHVLTPEVFLPLWKAINGE